MIFRTPLRIASRRSSRETEVGLADADRNRIDSGLLHEPSGAFGICHVPLPGRREQKGVRLSLDGHRGRMGDAADLPRCIHQLVAAYLLVGKHHHPETALHRLHDPLVARGLVEEQARGDRDPVADGLRGIRHGEKGFHVPALEVARCISAPFRIIHHAGE
ncbi:MAG: hypothetical protein ABSG21_00435 [Spirochaetia bacterium]